MWNQQVLLSATNLHPERMKSKHFTLLVYQGILLEESSQATITDLLKMTISVENACPPPRIEMTDATSY